MNYDALRFFFIYLHFIYYHFWIISVRFVILYYGLNIH